jgi:hypothetical protein
MISAHAVLQPFGQFVNAMWVWYFGGISQFSVCDGLVCQLGGGQGHFGAALP